MRTKKNKILIFFLVWLPFLTSCEDLFTRFKYETYECDKNPTRLKKIFIKNYEVGEIVEVEFENEGFELKIIENTDFLMNLKRSNPKISSSSFFVEICFNSELLNLGGSSFEIFTPSLDWTSRFSL